jgi:amino acid adenylation domain-containing protein/non-ribosomal peptide synthase protein (TIGR01720 family)
VSTTANALLDEIHNRGVTLWREGDRIRYRGPKGALTPDLVERLRARRQEIVSLLEAGTIAVAGSDLPAAADEADVALPAPLSFSQEALWFLHQIGGDASLAAYNVPTALRLRGRLDAAAFERGLALIVQRHGSLRTKFCFSDHGALQMLETGASPMKMIDLSSLARDAQEVAVRRCIGAEAAHAFALGAAPPVRFTLLRLAPNHHVFVSVMHHLVTDGWSMWVLFRELQALYPAVAAGRPSPLPALPLQYADHASAERRMLSDEALAVSRKFWRTQMHEAPPAIDLPFARPRPTQHSYRGAVVRFDFDRARTAALKQLAQQCNASLFMILLAAYAVVLARLAAKTEVVIGTPVANRDRPETEALIGLFAHYIPLRVDLQGDPTVRDLVGRVRRTSLDCYAHQRMPYQKIVEAAQPDRIPGRAPLFQVALVLQNLPAIPLLLPGLEIEQLQIDRATAKLDISVLLEEIGGIIHGELEYSTDLFEAPMAARLARYLMRIADGFTQNPDCRVSQLPLLDTGERAALVKRWSGAGEVRSESGLLCDGFRAQVARTPTAQAVIAGAERLSYAELAARVARMSRQLASLGVAAGDRVAVCLPRSADLIVALLAVLEAGAAYVPLDASHPPERLASMIADAGARIVVNTAEMMRHLPKRADVICVCVDRDADAIASHQPQPLQRSGSPDELAYLIYTSGSTGRPKGIMVAHRAACSLVRALADAVYGRYTAPINVALVASAAFDASVQQIFASLLLGHTLCIVDDDTRRDGERLLDFFDAHEIVLSDATPSLLRVLLEAGMGTRPEARLRHLLVGGEALPARLVERLHNQDAGKRITVTNVYGPTECGVDDTFMTVRPGERIGREYVPIGRPLSNARVYVLDAHGQPAAVGGRGEIHIGGPCLARGYSARPALTAQAYRPDPFVAGERLYATGDCGRWTEDGEIEFLGRLDDQLKVRGYRVEPAEIEAALLRHPAIKHVIVAADPASGDTARLIAYVVPRGAAPTVAVLRDFLSSLLPAYMIPSAFVVVDALPLNASGKIDRTRLAGQGGRELEHGSTFIAPRSDRERALAQAWATVLGRPTIGAGDQFFSLGGDSIKALQVVAKLRQAGWRLELSDFVSQPTLLLLAPLLKPAVESAVRPAATSGPVPLGPVQAAFLRDEAGPKHHFHQALLFVPAAPLNVEALNAAIAAVFGHHDALRMTFKRADGRWLQQASAAATPPVTEVVDLSWRQPGTADLPAHASAMMAATDLANGPLFRAVLYRLADGERLLLATHHLVVDGVSWRILVEDLDSTYQQALAGRPASVAPTTDSYALWAAGVHSAAVDAAERERGYWRAVEEAPSARLPLDAPDAAAHQRDRAECSLVLPKTLTTQLLTSAHDAYATWIDDLMLTGLARALTAWTQQRCWRVLLESHGRLPLWRGADVSRTVGWFTARYPVLLNLEGIDDIGRAIKSVKEMLRGVPNGGSMYEAIKYLTEAADAAALPRIAVNYLGQIGRELRAQSWTWVDESCGDLIAPNAPLVNDLDILGYIANDRLHLLIRYGRPRLTDETVGRFAAALERALVEVVEHAAAKTDRELTPSDIDYDGFDIDGLDEFMRNL